MILWSTLAQMQEMIGQDQTGLQLDQRRGLCSNDDVVAQILPQDY